MSTAFWVVGNAPTATQVSHVCSSYIQSPNINPSLPAYVQPTEHVPVIIAFNNQNTATRFISKQLHVSPIHQNNLNQIERPFITYATNHVSKKDRYEMFPILLTGEDTFLTNLVVTSFSRFFVVDTFLESSKMVTLEGELIDPMSDLDVKSQLNVQHLIFDTLEDMYNG